MRKRTRNILLISLAMLLIIIVAAGFYLHHRMPAYLTQKIEEELTNVLNKDIENLYHVEVDEISLSRTFGEMHIPMIKITPNEEILSNTDAEELPAQIFRVTLENIAISTGGLIDLARNKSEIDFSSIYLQKGAVSILSNNKSTLSDTTSTNTMEAFSIGKFRTDLLMFEQISFQDSAAKLLKIDSIMMEAGIIWNNPSNAESNQYTISNYTFNTQEVIISPAEEFYNHQIGQIRFSHTDSILKLMDISLSPIYEKSEYSQHMTYQTDVVIANIKSVAISTININQLLNEETFRTNKISIEDGYADIFRDRNLVLDTLRRPLMPVRLIRTASFPFAVQTLDIKGIDLKYSELPANGNEEGIVPLPGLEGTIRNITNIESDLQSDSIMRIEASAKFFGEALLDARFTYNLMDLNGGYTANGTLASLDFKKLNQLFKALLNVEVEDGYHEKNQFSFSGNDFHTTGEITMYYSDLKIVETDKSKLRKTVVGWAGRNFLYYPSNPRNNELRTGTIDFPRDPSRFAIHYWWQSYLSGIKSSVIRGNIDI